MDICVCSNCGNHIHINASLENKCFFCGMKTEITIKQDNTYLEMVINECEKEVYAQNYKKAIELYDTYIECFSNISELYWGRFMARSSCYNDEQLLRQGVNFFDDIDYILACHFANDLEKECYEKLAKTREIIEKNVICALEKHERYVICSTGIEEVQKITLVEIERLNEELTNKIQHLDSIEKKLRDKTVDCMIRIQSGQIVVNNSVNKLEDKKNQISRQSEVNNSKYKEYKVEIMRDLGVCSYAWSMIQKLKSTPMFQEQSSIENEQREAERAVFVVITEIDAVKEKMSKVLDKIAKIKHSHKNAIDNVKAKSFSEGVSILGDEQFNEIFIKALQT